MIALVAAYNEEDVISPVLEHLIQNGIEVYLLDNHSTDTTVQEASRWLGRGLIDVETFPAEPPAGGLFDWTGILRRKEELVRQLDADWFIHHDADEIREGPFPGLSLKEAIQWVDLLGYSAVNFRVLNFPPVDDGYRLGHDPGDYFRHYEEGAMFDALQVKAWKAPGARRFSITDSGGHEIRIRGRRVFPIRFILRHYPVRSQSHGLRKVFRERKGRFVELERARGWHVQYDEVRDESHSFLRDPARLSLFDLERVRLELLLERGRSGRAAAAAFTATAAPGDQPASVDGFTDLRHGEDGARASGDASRTDLLLGTTASADTDGTDHPETWLGLVDVLLRKEESIRDLLDGNYRNERHLATWLVPEISRRREELEFLTQKLRAGASAHEVGSSHGRGPATWGDFRRTAPWSPVCGSDRGICIDRHYIETFLQSHAHDIGGNVLEVHDSIYTWRYGGDRVRRADVIDLDATNPNATIVADLRNATVVPSASYDCIILTQTLHLIYEMPVVAAECRRLLKPGGVLLATFPCLNRVDDEAGLDGDFWRLTESAVRQLFAAFFPSEHLDVQSHGNILVSIAFLYGLASHELAPEELNRVDPQHALDVTLRAVAPR